MCLWLITACLGLLPTNQQSTNNVIVVGAPAPILQPTAAPTTTTTTTARPPGNMTVPPPLTTNPPVVTTTTTMRPPPPPPPPPPPTTAAPTNPPPPATTNAPSTTPGVVNVVNLPVRICLDANIVCVANPNQPVTGAPLIDPRLGSTPPAAYFQQITGYSAPLPAYDSAVRFPQKRSIRRYRMNDTEELIKTVANAETHVRRKRQNTCTCVAAGTCPTVATGGAGLIDFRIVTPAGQCLGGLVYCCVPATIPATIACGTRQTVPSTNIVISAGQARFGDYPWMAIILTNQNDYIAGGVLIDQYNVLTVIHRLTPYLVSGTVPNAKVRLGEWDAAGTYEPIPFQEYTIRRVFTHPSFNAATLQYDIAVVRLSTPVPFTPSVGAAPTINRACLPTANTAYTGQRCYVTGWGRNAFVTGQYQQILKEVDVPIVDPTTCQSQLRNARLGASYVLDTTSFICAGGEVNKDACTGDGGSGLVCQVDGRWTVVGIVTWGLGCAMANVPGVYINVPSLLPWIQQQVATA